MSLILRLSGGKWGLVTGVVLLLLASPLLAPQLLAFSHRVVTPVGPVYSERPLSQAMLQAAVARVKTRVATSPLADLPETRPVFITDGGWRWRWRWLSTTSHDTFAITRPLTRAVVVNTTNPVTGLVRNDPNSDTGREIGGILAHEYCHGMIRRRFGVVATIRFPRWKVEGYCDYVAGESTLSAADAERLEAAGIDHPALLYYRGRLRVASELAANGNSVDALFTGAPRPHARK